MEISQPDQSPFLNGIPGVHLEHTWKTPLLDELGKPYMQQLKRFLEAEVATGNCFYPASANIFNALNLTPPARVKVIILGQDPYHGPGQAHGLSFSVPEKTPLPPSLRNIFKELDSDLGIPPSPTGDLTPWAKQGVLLLNATLTVQQGKAGSHQGHGWEKFTDTIIQQLSSTKTNLVFILWGAYAQKKGAFIDGDRHLVIRSPHPSPLSAHRGFFGSKPFSKTNQYLAKSGQREIHWNLTTS